MGVNSTFKIFLNRLMVRSHIALLICGVFFTASSFTEPSHRDLRAKEVNLIIRMIGHRLLLQAGDWTSRVLPVKEVNEGTFLLQFEKEFLFSHDSLLLLTQTLLPKARFPSGYTVTVHDCSKRDIVYGFQENNSSPDLSPCRGRSEPSGCYTIEIAFADLYGNIEREKAETDHLPEKPTSFRIEAPDSRPEGTNPIEVDRQKAKPALEKLHAFKIDPQDADPRLKQSKTTSSDYPLAALIFSGMVVLVGVGLLVGRYGKSIVPVVQNDDRPVTKGSAPEAPALGKFLFDAKDQHLRIGSQVIRLTDKECRILELLNKNFGELIPRETLMQEVWINEGVITGRSLDMFVSKLRKKLSSDPELRITNIHGKGYKLEIAAV